MRRFLLFALLAYTTGSLLVYLFGDSGVSAFNRLTDYRDRLERNVGDLDDLNRSLQAELASLRDDPRRTEVLARDLGLYRPGDRVLRIEGARAGVEPYEVGSLLRLKPPRHRPRALAQDGGHRRRRSRWHRRLPVRPAQPAPSPWCSPPLTPHRWTHSPRCSREAAWRSYPATRSTESSASIPRPRRGSGRLKGRDEGKPFLRLAADASWARTLTGRAAPEHLARYRPGPLTLVLPLRGRRDAGAARPRRGVAARAHRRPGEAAAVHEREPLRGAQRCGGWRT